MGTRKDQATLTDDEKQRFVNAVLQLKENNGYDQYVEWHRELFLQGIHSSAMFLPWHRELILRFERDLQRIDSSVDIPYWNWSVNQSQTESLWQASFLGGNGQGSNGLVADGPFAFTANNFELQVTDTPSDGPGLRRNFASFNPSLDGFESLPGEGLVRTVLRLPNYTIFNANIRGRLHNMPHRWVGGAMASMSSPNDPVFWMHHANLDRLWMEWQLLHPRVPHYEGSNASMPPWFGDATPLSVVDHRILAYRYDTEPDVDIDSDSGFGVGTGSLSGSGFGAGIGSLSGVDLGGSSPFITDLVVGAAAVNADISRGSETDVYRIIVTSFGTYIIETQGNTDVVAMLMGPDSQTELVTENDDGGEGANARIESHLSPGTYFIRIRHYNPANTGPYTISVAATATSPASIPELTVNGDAVNGDIAAANESDVYIFTANFSGLYTIETEGNTDTYLSLYGPDVQTNLLGFNDDSGQDRNSQLVADLRPGIYYLRIRHYSATGTGTYSVSVVR